jgi:general stress protein 26
MENFIHLERIKQFISTRKVAFIASIDNEGFPNVKCMLSPGKIEGLKTFWFSTNTSSMRVAQYRKNPKACIYFYCKGLKKYQGIMLKGTMEVLEDDEIKKELWQIGDEIYYPKGVTDPDYCVLKFTAISGRYYPDGESESFKIE